MIQKILSTSILFLLLANVFFIQNVRAEDNCLNLFSKREKLLVRMTLKAPDAEVATQYFGFFTKDPRASNEPTTWYKKYWNNTKETFKYGPRKIAKFVIKDEDYRFSPFKPIGLVFTYIPRVIEKYTGELLVEKLSEHYLGIKKHLRLWLKIPLYALILFYPTDYAYDKMETYLSAQETRAELVFEQKLSDHKAAHLERVQNDFRFNDIKISYEMETQKNTSVSEIQLFKAANKRAEEILAYQGLRDEVQNKPLTEQSATFLASPLFNQVRAYTLSQQNNGTPVPEEKVNTLVQLTNHYLISLEVVDMYVQSPVLYKAQKRIANEEQNQTLLEIMAEIETHEFTRDTITKYYHWGVLPQNQYQHYLQAFYYYRYQLAFAEITGNIPLKDKNKPATPDNIRTHEDILQMLALQLFQNNPQVVERVKSEIENTQP